MKKALVFIVLAVFLLVPVFAEQTKDEVEKMICSCIREGTVIKINGKNSDNNNFTVIFAKQNVSKYTIEFSKFYEGYYLLIDNDKTYYNFADYEFSLDKDKNLIITEKTGKR